jgi:hypothetical protein
MEIARLRPGAKLEMNFSITTRIALRDVEFVDGKAAQTILRDFLRIVEGIVVTIESEARRLGLI